MDWSYVPTWSSIAGSYESTSKYLGSWFQAPSQPSTAPASGGGASSDLVFIAHRDDETGSYVLRQQPAQEEEGADPTHSRLDESSPAFLLDGEEKILGCFESNCSVQFGWLQGYRRCARCRRHFCYRHCRYRRPRASSAASQPAPPDDYACLKCARLEPQTVGHTLDRTAAFLEMRSTRKRQGIEEEGLIQELQRLSRELYETQERKKKRQERFQQRAEAGEVKPIESALGTMTSSVSPLIKWSTSAISDWAQAPSDKSCFLCQRPFGYLAMLEKYVCKLCKRAACEECCKYEVSLGRSTVNNKVPLSVTGFVRCCKPCSQVICKREEILQFKQKLKRSREDPLKLLYDGITTIKSEIDQKLKQYFDLISSVDIMDGFEVVDELESEKQVCEEENCDRWKDVEIEWAEENDWTKKKTKTKQKKKDRVHKKTKGRNTEDEMKHLSDAQIAMRDVLKKEVMELLEQYQEQVRGLMSFHCRSVKESCLVRAVRIALWEHKNDCLPSFQKTLNSKEHPSQKQPEPENARTSREKATTDQNNSSDTDSAD